VEYTQEVEVLRASARGLRRGHCWLGPPSDARAAENFTIAFSGDIGNPIRHLKRSDPADEGGLRGHGSTYATGARPRLVYIAEPPRSSRRLRRGGNVVNPLSRGPQQEMLYILRQIKAEAASRASGLHVYVDSRWPSSHQCSETDISSFDEDDPRADPAGHHPIAFSGLGPSVTSDDPRPSTRPKNPP
jgi:hypothetical protein